MEENHQDNVENKLITTENVKWVLNKKNTLFIPKHKKRTGFEDKTRWDWLQLIIQAIGVIVIPISIVLGVWQFTTQQQNDRLKSIDEQQQTTLQNYLSNMSDLMLKENLLGSKSTDVVRQIAEAQTLTAIENLNPARKVILVKFLYDSHLIGYYDGALEPPIIDLSGTNLSAANLSKAPLSGADLLLADLSNADLSDTTLDYANLGVATLRGADLSGAILDNATLREADLSGANLHQADLSGADLVYADLADAHLDGAILNGADLGGVNLSGADLNGADLSDTKDLIQYYLDQAFSCKGAILPQGLTCHQTG